MPSSLGTAATTTTSSKRRAAARRILLLLLLSVVSCFSVVQYCPILTSSSSMITMMKGVPWCFFERQGIRIKRRYDDDRFFCIPIGVQRNAREKCRRKSKTVQRITPKRRRSNVFGKNAKQRKSVRFTGGFSVLPEHGDERGGGRSVDDGGCGVWE